MNHPGQVRGLSPNKQVHLVHQDQEIREQIQDNPVVTIVVLMFAMLTINGIFTLGFRGYLKKKAKMRQVLYWGCFTGVNKAASERERQILEVR